MRTLLISFSLASLTVIAQPKPPVTIKPAAAPMTPAKKIPFDKAAVGEYVKNIEMWPKDLELKIGDPKPSAYLPGFQEFSVAAIYQGREVLQRLYYLAPDGKRFIQGNVFMMDKHPFQRNIDHLKTDLMPSFGTPGAPVTIVIFSDFECPYCREEAKTLRDKLPKEFANDVRVYYKEFPLTSIHPWSMKSAVAGRCVFRANPEAFWDYHDWIFDKQPEITPENVDSKILEWAGTKGLDTLQLTRCMETSATEPEVRKNMEEGFALGVDRTPTLFLNGRPIEGSTWDQLKARIEFELGYQKTAKNAGEKCCEVTIPGAVK
ncbi:MAG TPA: thioredoxin domain-containing protein [Bryobacteraceae bacterium]|jgi:protein-disulfide isomerase